jgi:hypothetical protein
MLGTVAGSAVAFLVLYLVFSTIGWSVIRSFRRKKIGEEQRRRVWDRSLGALFGAGKTFFLLYIVLCGLVLVEKPLNRVVQGEDLGYRDSVMVSFARSHNLLAGLHLPVVGNVEAMGRLANDPAFREKVANDPKIKKLLEHPKFKALLGDPALMQEAQVDDLSGLLANPKLNEALEDPEIRKLLSEVDLSKL